MKALVSSLLICAALAGCGGGSGGTDTGLGFSVKVDGSATPQAQLQQYAQGLFDHIQLDPTLEKCALSHVAATDPTLLTGIASLPSDQQATARQKLNEAFLKGCALNAGNIVESNPDEATLRYVAFSVRTELEQTLGSQGGAYATCVGAALDKLSDSELVDVVQNPEKAKTTASSIVSSCGPSPTG